MRSGTLWGTAVLASLALLVSGQLCMLTTCVPRLQRMTAQAGSCCHAMPSDDAGAPAPMPAGAMPCGQASQLASAPLLDAPLPVATPCALGHEVALAPEPVEAIELAPIERDTGPVPGVHSPAPAGLRAPPRA